MSLDNTVKYGLSNLHIAFLEDEGWKTPVAVPGVVNIELSPSGDESTFYADNRKYFVSTKNSGYTGSIETANLPDEILAEALGWYFDAHKNLVEDADGVQKPFAIGAQINGDVKNRRFWLYECKMARPDTSAATSEDTITPKTDKCNLTVVAHNFPEIDKNIVRIISYQGETDYNNFFTAVVEPAAEASA